MWFNFFLLVASFVISYVMRPHPDDMVGDPAALEDFDVPTASEDRPIPVVFGDVAVTGANVAWYGDLRVEEVKKKVKTGMFSSKNVVVGHKYHLGFHMVFCHGSVDEIYRIDVGSKTAWTGSVLGAGDVEINNENLFGGEEKGGGVRAILSFQDGDIAQPANDYLVGQLGDVPAYRGVSGVIINGPSSDLFPTEVIHFGFGDFTLLFPVLSGYIGTSPNIPTWTFYVRKAPGAGWYPSKASIGTEANPAHIIYECITNQEWGMGYTPSTLDDAAFKSAADTFYSEGFGLSFQWTQQQKIEDFISTVLNHVDASLSLDFKTGLFVLKPSRDDYDPLTLPVFDESNCTLESFTRPALSDLITEVTAIYTDRANRKKQSVTVHNLGAIHVQGSSVSATRRYTGINSSDLALRAASRDIKNVSLPLARVRMTVNRAAWNLQVSDVIALSWDKYGLSKLPVRVTAVRMGEPLDGRIVIDAVEDIWGMSATSYTALQSPGWTPPTTVPVPVPYGLVYEAPYYEVARDTTPTERADFPSTWGAAFTLASRPSGDSFDYELWSRQGTADYGLRAQGVWAPTAVLAADVGYLDTTLTFNQAVDFSSLASVAGQPGVSLYTSVGSELMVVTGADITAGTITVERGTLDTIAQTHLAGERIWFPTEFYTSGPDIYSDADVVDVKLLPRTSSGTLAISSATALSVTMDQRAHRPYPPGKFRINADPYPTAILGDLAVSWAHRDRTNLSLVGEADASVGPEAGTTYTVTVHDEDLTVVHTETGLTGTSWAYVNEEDESGEVSTAPTRDLISPAGNSYSEVVLSDSPYGYWPMGGATATDMAVDYSGNGDNLSPSGTVTSAADLIIGGTDGAAGFSNPSTNPRIQANPYNQVSFVSSNSGPCSIEVWASPISFGDNYFVYCGLENSNARLIALSFVQDAVPNTYLQWRPVGGNIWFGPLGAGPYHVVFVVPVGATHTSDCFAYVNGVKYAGVRQSGVDEPLEIYDVYFAFGGAHGKITNDFTGTLDEGAVYSYELTETQILRHYNSGTGNDVPLPVVPKDEIRMNGVLQVELDSQRDGLNSRQKHNWSFDRAGYGYNYSKYYGGIQ